MKYTFDNQNFAHVLQDFDPALVIVDAPQWEVVQNIKSNENYKHIAVLLMTGYNSTSELRGLPSMWWQNLSTFRILQTRLKRC